VIGQSAFEGGSYLKKYPEVSAAGGASEKPAESHKLGGNDCISGETKGNLSSDFIEIWKYLNGNTCSQYLTLMDDHNTLN